MTNDNEVQGRMLLMANNLLAATKEGKITWRLTDAEAKFIYAGTRSSVTIEFVSDRFNDEMTVLCLLNDKGTVVDSLETGGVHEGDRFIPASWNEILDDLYHAARRVAYNVDEALDSILSDIERGAPSPPSPPPGKKRFGSDDPWTQAGSSDEPPF